MRSEKGREEPEEWGATQRKEQVQSPWSKKELSMLRKEKVSVWLEHGD